MPKPPELDADLLLKAYAHGIFPMARHRDDEELYFVSPEDRGIIPLETFHISRRLARTVRSDRFVVRIDRAFDEVITACAEAAPDREESWINAQIVSLYAQLYRAGHAHTVECWHQDRLVGGLYGVSLGGAFFGESMFSRERDASKVALVHLVARLRSTGFRLLDAQFLTAHLAQFGAVAIPRQRYLELLADAISGKADFRCPKVYCPAPSGNSGTFSFAPESGEVALTGAVEATTGATWPGWFVLQLITQTS
ncbi:MAG TPA: leucyl/phenylalanyl-tRNA--protein transferase [Rhizomicrobium sp.]|jgi:leucyl/phenylalanyl-tRNA--protein transferase|nr:leucyl/phenylalanyl-tRNA--protein transferase [Rhizomicrobium sp.]